MTLIRFVYKTHKWLAVAALLASLFWFVSGVVMMTPLRFFGDRPFYEKPQPGDLTLRDAKVSVSEAVAAVDAAAGTPVKLTGARLKSFAGLVVYEISTAGSGVHLVDATSGSRLEIDAELAQKLVMRYAREGTRFCETSLLHERAREYPWGPLPAWRVALDDDRGTLFFVGKETGELSFSDRYGRLRRWIVGWHSFAFLKGWFPGTAIRAIMWVFSVVGTAMIFFGCCILWIQWKNWLAASATGRRAAGAR